MKEIPIQVSARHIHLAQNHLDALFGKGYQLKKLRPLEQPGEFLAQEKIDIQNVLPGQQKRTLSLSILGPVRHKTQVELSHTDAIFLRIKPVVRESGDIERTSGAVLVGPKGTIEIKQGVINAWRHIHCNPREAKELGLKDGMLISVKTSGICALTFHKVKVKVKPNAQLCMHLDTDEGNAACITTKGTGYLS